MILVAEDETSVRDFIRDILETAGYIVLTAADGEEALQVARSFPGTIHLLVSNVQMPKLGGMALRELILRERPAIQVLLVSGTLEKAGEDVEFLHKPFLAETLRNRVLRLLPAVCGSS